MREQRGGPRALQRAEGLTATNLCNQEGGLSAMVATII